MFALFEAGSQVILSQPQPHVSAAPHVGLTMFALFEGIQRQLVYSLLPLSESQFSTVQLEMFSIVGLYCKVTQ
jgi:hypothetical protein